MAEITPTPKAGSWVEASPFAGPWAPQPKAGSWVKCAGYTFPRPGFRNLGLTRGARSVS